MKAIAVKRITADEAMKKYPRLVAHLICESLGYFTPMSAANAIAHYINGEPFYCEWYYHMAQCGGELRAGETLDRRMLEIGRERLKYAYCGRKSHTGYMAHYPLARSMVDRAIQHGEQPNFDLMSW